MLNLPEWNCNRRTFSTADFLCVFVFFLSGTVSVLSDNLYYAPGIGVQGSISFEGCIAQNCMNELVIIEFVVENPDKRNKTLASTKVIPGFLPYPVTGLLNYTSPIDSGVRKFVQIVYDKGDLLPGYLLKEVRLEERKLSCEHFFLIGLCLFLIKFRYCSSWISL